MEKKYPIGGYAPGNYTRKCTSCNEHFQGDKRAVQCEPCAIEAKERFDSLDPNEQQLLIKRNAMIANFMFSGPLTPERELIYRIVEQWGNLIEMPNMEGWLKEYAAKQAAPKGAVWVKAYNGMPDGIYNMKVASKIRHVVMLGVGSVVGGEIVLITFLNKTTFGKEDVQKEDVTVYYLDENPAPSKESDAADVIEFAEWAAEIAWFDEEYRLWNFFEEGKMVDGRFRFTTSEFYELFNQSK